MALRRIQYLRQTVHLVLTESEYQSALTTPHDRNSNTKLSRSMRIATLDEWSTLPVFAKVLGELQHQFPNISVATVSRKVCLKITVPNIMMPTLRRWD